MPRSNTPIVLVVILLLSIPVVALPVWGEQAGAESAISSAKNTIVTCYSAAREAEAAGANITALTATLNEAGALLSQAEFAYSTDDFASAVNFASQSQSALTGFIEEATALKEAATQQQNQDFLIYIGSIIGTFIVIIGGGAVWVFLKKKYEPTKVDVSESPSV